MPAQMRVAVTCMFVTLVLVVTACAEASGSREQSSSDVSERTPSQAHDEDEAAPANADDDLQPSPTPDASPTADASEQPDAVNNETDDLPRWTESWNDTAFSQRTVDLDEIMSGGVPRDGIPPIDNPAYEDDFTVVDEWLEPQEPVIRVELDGDPRAFPLQIMTWHEIVNTEIGGTPVTVTFCPLCNSAVAFERDLEEQGVTRFGVSGLLRNSDLIMWDDHTESLWQQITGEAIVGEMAGERLAMLPSIIMSYEKFKEAHPDGSVLTRDTGHSRPYGNNPYVGYDNIDQSPFLFQEIPDDRLPPMMRVLVLDLNGEAVAYPFSELEEQPVVHDEVGGEPVVVFWQAGATSALDQTDIAGSQDVGMAAAFSPVLNGDHLTFQAAQDGFQDQETGSIWNIAGHAIDGPLQGQRMEEYISGSHFWFAWAAFQPETTVWSPLPRNSSSGSC